MDSFAARVGSLALKVWLRSTSPGGMRLLAPVLGVALFLALRYWYLRAGRTALGRGLRWWTLALALALVCAAAIYLVAGGPEDPEALEALRSAQSELIGRAPLPRPLAAAGGVLVAAAALAAGWRWRQAKQLPDERDALAAQWRAVRGRWLLSLAALVGVPCAALVTACAAAAVGPPQVPAALAGATGGAAGMHGSLWV